jgi:hypothetical protein
MSFLGSFEHTTGKTWGGRQISPGILQATSLLGGFFGLDHLLLRSPQTALLKFIFNVVTLGLWYWYDVIQVFQDMDFVKEYGFTLPIKGPVGLGAGIVGDSSGPGAAPKGTPSPFMFLAYVALLFVPFGVSNFFAGDFKGGAAKFFLTFYFFTTVLGLLWSLFSIFYATFNTKSLLTRGVDRFFPVTLFMDPYGPSPTLVTPGIKKAEDEIAEDSIFTKVYNMIFGVVEKPILEAVVSVAEPVVETAEEIRNTAAATEKTPQVGGALNAVTNTALLMSTQQGGASDITSKALFLGATSLIFIGSILITYFRYFGGEKGVKQKETSKISEKNDIPPEGFQNDVPPGPRVL